MVYHVPHFMKLHNGIKQFSGQGKTSFLSNIFVIPYSYILILIGINYVGVEKLNDTVRRIHLQKSNKWDAAQDVVLAEERLRVLSELKRTPRSYKKRANDYWSNGIKESRRRRLRLCDGEEVSDCSEDISTLTPEILRSRLKDLGVTTRVRKLDRLLEMYIALQTQSH